MQYRNKSGDLFELIGTLRDGSPAYTVAYVPYFGLASCKYETEGLTPCEGAVVDVYAWRDADGSVKLGLEAPEVPLAKGVCVITWEVPDVDTKPTARSTKRRTRRS